MFRQPFVSIPGSFDGSSGTLKRKRVGEDFGSATTFNSTIGKRKRSKYNEVPHLPSTQYSKSEKLFKVRVLDDPVWPATTAVYVSGHETQALSDSGKFGVLPSDREANGCYKKSQLDLRRSWHDPPAHYTADEDSDNATRKTTRNLKTDSMTVEERKHFFIHTPTEGMKAATKKYLSDIYQLLDMSGSNDDCRLHPTPPQLNGKPVRAISFGFNWSDDHGCHRLTVDWGVVALVVRQQLTDDQMDGFINKSWHLSHLCGNWTCCNWRHFTVESGPINCSRNGCFNSPVKCTHNPPCMEEKKRQLLVTDNIRSEISKAITSLGGILSYEAFHALAEYDIRLVGCFWENSKRGFCAFCGRSDDKAHICSSLSSLVNCKVMLRAFKQCVKPTSEVREAIGYLVKIREDLERGSTVKDKTLTEWLFSPGRCTELEQTSPRLKKTRREPRKKRPEVPSKCRQPGSTAENVDQLDEVENPHLKSLQATRSGLQELKKFRKV